MQTRENILWCAPRRCFYPHITKRIPGRFAAVKPPFAVEDNKRPQVSALPERRVIKQRRAAFTGFFRKSFSGFHFLYNSIFPLHGMLPAKKLKGQPHEEAALHISFESESVGRVETVIHASFIHQHNNTVAFGICHVKVAALIRQRHIYVHPAV